MKTNLLKISNAASLAMHMMAFIAAEPKKLNTTSKIAGILGVSEHHLAKVRQRLSRAGLVNAQRGPGGGMRLAKPAVKITLLNVYEAIEGHFEVVTCLFGLPECLRTSCILNGLIEKVNRDMKKYLEKTTLAKLNKTR